MFGKQTAVNRSRRTSGQAHHRTCTRRALVEFLGTRELMAADLGIIDDGHLPALISELQSRLNQQVFMAEAPLLGTQLATDAELQFIENKLASRFSTLNLGNDVSAEGVRLSLQNALSSGDLLAGDVIITDGTHDAVNGDREVRFLIPLSFSVSSQVALDLGLGDQSNLDIIADGAEDVDVVVQVQLNLEIGVRELADGSSQFFVSTGAQNEMQVMVDARLRDDYANGQGRMGVFVADFAASDSPSTFHGTYFIDFEGNGTLAIDQLGEFSLSAIMDGSAEINLNAAGAFLPTIDGLNANSVFNLGVTTKVTVTYQFDHASTNIFDASGKQIQVLGAFPEIEFSNNRLDLGTFFRDFIDPALTSIRDTILPMKPVVDLLSKPLPVIGEFTDKTLLDAMEAAVNAMAPSARKEQYQRDLRNARSIITTMAHLMEYRTPGTADIDTLSLGSVSYTYNHVFESDDARDQREKQEERVKTQVKNRDFSFVKPTEEGKEPKSVTQFKAEFDGELTFPLLTSESAIAGLLLGDASTTLFSADLKFDLSLSKEITVPIPALAFLANGEFSFEVSAGVDLGFGFDAQGISDFTWALDYSNLENFELSKIQNQHLLNRGFYIDDHFYSGEDESVKVIDGNRISHKEVLLPGEEAPEAYIEAEMALGASLGPDFSALTAKAELLGTLSVGLNVDLNDLPDTLPANQWIDPYTPTRPTNAADWTYDGHIRMDEIQEIIDYDPAYLVNVSGEIIAGVDAGIEISIGPWDLVDFHTTLAQVTLANFKITDHNDANLVNQVQSGVILGELAADRTLNVFAGNTAGSRQGVVGGTSSDERFRVTTLRESDSGEGYDVQIVFWYPSNGSSRAFRETFKNVSQVRIDAGSGADALIADPSGLVPVTLIGGDGDDLIFGGAGNDTLIGGNGADTIHGASGNDRIEGGAGEDQLFGDSGNDEIYGGDDDDEIFGGEGDDIAFGQQGVDELHGGLGDDELRGGSGNDVIYGEEGSDTIYGDAGNDWIHGDTYLDIFYKPLLSGAGNDTVYGGDGEDTIRGGWGRDTLDGGAQNDVVFGEGDSDWVSGGLGDDLLYGDALIDISGGADALRGDAGNDELHGGWGNDNLDGGDGNDWLFGEGNNDTVRGGSGDDTLYGDAIIDAFGWADSLYGDDGNDALHGGWGNDSLDGGAGSDVLYGEGDSDTLHGGSGDDLLYGDAIIDAFGWADRLYGDEGNDTLHGGWGNDTLDGGSGNDTAYGEGDNDSVYGSSGNDVLYGDAIVDLVGGNDMLRGGDGDDRIYGGWGNDRLYGDNGNDSLYGDMGADTIYGGAGNDYVYGGWGSDSLYGESGNDRIYGDLGNDYIRGGTGNDYLDGGLGADRLYGDAGNDTLDGGRLLGGRDFARDYLDGGAGYDTIYAQWYWIFGWYTEETVVGGERVL